MSDERTEGHDGDANRPNIAVVVLDTLRKDFFDEYFGWLPGRRFENAWAPSHWTVPVHGSLFTGRYATETGVHSKSPSFDYPGETLPERLGDAGYRTRAFSCNVNISPQMGFDRGFEEFTGNWRVSTMGEDLFDWGTFAAETDRQGLSKYLAGVYEAIKHDSSTYRSLKRGLLLKLRDLDLNGALVDDGAREAKQYVRSTEFRDGEFLFLNLMEAHAPYLPPRGYRTVERVDPDAIDATFGEESPDLETARTAYRDSVRYLSDIYQDIYEELRQDFDYIVTLSDHGELLGEHDVWDHQFGVYPELVHVPLVVDGPGLSGERPQTVSLLDVPETVLDAAGAGSLTPHGRSLLGKPRGDEFLTEYHGLTENRRESLRETEMTAERIDTEFRGIAAPGDYYGYETLDEFVERGEWTETVDPEERLNQLVTGLTRREVETEGFSKELEEHLDDLGYL